MTARASFVGALVAAALIAPAAAAQQPQPAQRERPRTGVDTLRANLVAPRIEYRREVFTYQGGSRDPFRTLISSSDVRPTMTDLRLVSIAFDPRGMSSVAVVREAGNPRAHRLRRGDQIGRLRVVQIRQYSVVFRIEEFGFERQEELALPRAEVIR